jgi:hypothetical protein
MSTSSPSPLRSELGEAVAEAIRHLLVVKGRLPVLRALVQELPKVGQLAGGDGGGYPILNGSALQMARDSFDMLVIDLASLREGAAERGGAFDRIRSHPEAFRRFSPDDFDPTRIHILGDPAPDEEAWLRGELMKEHVARANEILVRVFPEGEPVTRGHVDDLIRRFRRDTVITDRDRNRVRAHRYEEASKDAHHLAQTLTDVESQIRVFETYFNELYFSLTAGWFLMRPVGSPNPERTAQDLADIIVLGSINRAVVHYGVADATARNEGYSVRRERFYSPAPPT